MIIVEKVEIIDYNTLKYASEVAFLETLYIVVPCYNEADCLPLTAPVFRRELADLQRAGLAGPDSRVLLVDDGSADGTWDLIRSLHEADPAFAGLRLRPNRGHQNAVMAGLMEARERADVSISIDADLQDDIHAMEAMMRKHVQGFHIVCGVRSQRDTDTFLKRFTAQSYYKIMNLFGARLVYDHADYRLMDRTALDKLALYHVDDPFLRGLATRLGLEWATVAYKRTPRVAGESKYTLKKMINLAVRGLTCGRCKPKNTPRPPDPHIVERLFS